MESFAMRTSRQRYLGPHYSDRDAHGIPNFSDGASYNARRTTFCGSASSFAKPRKPARMSMKKTPGIRKTKTQKNRRFACTHADCNKRYFKQDHLEMHLRKHAGERPYSCSLCDRRFQRSDQLKRHGRRHTGEKPYECLKCHRAFARSDHLKTHMKTHTDRPYHCGWEDCKKKFAQPEELCQHFSTHKSQKARNVRGKTRTTSEQNTSVNTGSFDSNIPSSSNIIVHQGIINRSLPSVAEANFGHEYQSADVIIQ